MSPPLPAPLMMEKTAWTPTQTWITRRSRGSGSNKYDSSGSRATEWLSYTVDEVV